jgi:acyl-coenzyme A thioesterase PaaI-like protein
MPARLRRRPYNRRPVTDSEPRPDTHLAIDRRLCGRPLELAPGRARVELVTVPEMAADDRGLVHGGFVFGCADYAAMLAVNHPLVVLGAAEVRFLKPVRVGETVIAAARLAEEDGRRRRVEVTVERASGEGAGEPVLTGSFRCAVLDRHVLD